MGHSATRARADGSSALQFSLSRNMLRAVAILAVLGHVAYAIPGRYGRAAEDMEVAGGLNAPLAAEGGCVDKLDDCEFRAEDGQCKVTHTKFVSCRKSCESCDHCEDIPGNCEKLKKQGYCGKPGSE